MATSVHAERIKAALALLAGAKNDAVESGLAYLDLDDVSELVDLIQTLDAVIDSDLNGGP